MIYTGLRPTELLEIQTENVHLDEKYMVGGMKTEAGKDRIISLNDKIIPLVKIRYDSNKKYLINNKFGNHYTYGTYMNDTTKGTYTHKTLEELLAEVNKI